MVHLWLYPVIAVYKGYIVACHSVQACITRRGGTTIIFFMNDFNTLISSSVFVADGSTAISRAIINEYNL